MESLSLLWRGVASRISCKRARLSLSDLPPGLSWGRVVEAGLTLPIAFDAGTILVQTQGLGFEAVPGSRVSYFSHPEFECLTFIDLLDSQEAVKVAASFDECLILKFFDQLDYFNLPVSLVSRVEGQLEIGGTAVLVPEGDLFSLISTGRTRRSLSCAPVPCTNPAKHARSTFWDSPIPLEAALDSLSVAVHRESLLELQKAKSQSPGFVQQVEALKREVAGWRSIKGDGNCYYRAVGIAFLEHLARKSTEENEVWDFKLKVTKATGLFRVNPGFETSHVHFCALLDSLLSMKLSHPGAALLHLQPLLQVPAFDQCLHLMMRNYCYNGVTGRSLEAFQTEQGIAPEEILIPGLEAEGTALIGLPDVLGAAIFHYIIDGKSEQTYVEKYIPSGHGQVPLLLLAFFPGHYDLLYSHSQDRIDGFSYTRHSYDVSPRVFASVEETYVAV